MTKRNILHVRVGSKDWFPTEKQLEEIAELFNNARQDPNGAVITTRKDIVSKVLEEFDDVEVHSINEKFDSTDDKRLESNTFPDSLNPDDVSYNYRALSDEEKQDMREVKILAQNLINKIRSISSIIRTHTNNEQYTYSEASQKMLDEAVKNAQLASIWTTKVITGPKNNT